MGLDAGDLLLSVTSLLSLHRQQAQMEGRDFNEEDALLAVRPALESVLTELLALQDGPKNCPHCGRSMTTTEEDINNIIYDYENQPVDAIIDCLDEGLEMEDLKVLHNWEKKHQNRGTVLSKITQYYGGAVPADDSEKQAESEHIQRKVDSMFDDVFAKVKGL